MVYIRVRNSDAGSCKNFRNCEMNHGEALSKVTFRKYGPNGEDLTAALNAAGWRALPPAAVDARVTHTLEVRPA